jgi:hypothetical protein
MTFSFINTSNLSSTTKILRIVLNACPNPNDHQSKPSNSMHPKTHFLEISHF